MSLLPSSAESSNLKPRLTRSELNKMTEEKLRIAEKIKKAEERWGKNVGDAAIWRDWDRAFEETQVRST